MQEGMDLLMNDLIVLAARQGFAVSREKDVWVFEGPAGHTVKFLEPGDMVAYYRAEYRLSKAGLYIPKG